MCGREEGGDVGCRNCLTLFDESHDHGVSPGNLSLWRV